MTARQLRNKHRLKGESVSRIAKRVKPKTIRYLRKLAWNLLSQIIRLENSNHAGNVICYTCGASYHWREMQAGHAIGGRHNAVLLDTTIIRPQCVACNVFKRGNYPVFVAKLVRENGIDWYEEKLRESQTIKTYTRGDLEELIKNYRHRLQRISELEWV
jgi:hypothetical protein